MPTFQHTAHALDVARQGLLDDLATLPPAQLTWQPAPNE